MCIAWAKVRLQQSQAATRKRFVAFRHEKLPGFKIEFRTKMVVEAEAPLPISEQMEFVESEGGTIAIIREQKRGAAGLDGEEAAVAVTLPGEKPFVEFTWHYSGMPDSSTQPYIEVSAKAPKERREELERIWETILQSLRPVPVAGGALR